MRRRRVLRHRGLASLLAAALATACSPGTACEHASLPALAQAPRYAVVTSDYVVSAIALLDADGALLTEAWLDSGTTAAGIVTTIGGDVVLPSDLSTGVLTLIDRLGTDVVTRIDLPSGRVLDQTRAQLRGDGAAGFRANPQDAVALDDGGLLVTRLEPNLQLGAAELDLGNDAVVLDPTTMSLTRRISFDGANTTVGGETIYARPARIARFGSELLVGLQRLSRDFMLVADGAVAALDVAAGRVNVVPLLGFANCGEVVAAPGRAETGWVLCSGATFTSNAERAAQAGLVRLRRSGPATWEVSETWRSTSLVPSTGLSALDDQRVVFVAAGDATTRDRLVLVDISDGTTRVLDEAEDAFVMGETTFDAERGSLWATDARRGVARFDVAPSSVTARGIVDVSPCRRLGARAIRTVRGR